VPFDIQVDCCGGRDARGIGDAASWSIRIALADTNAAGNVEGMNAAIALAPDNAEYLLGSRS